MTKVSLVTFLSLFVLSSVAAEQNKTNGDKEVLEAVTSIPSIPTTASVPSIQISSSQQPFSTTLEPEIEPKRRQVTYDQRQEGQYNIRADLDNFMIVVIPPNPVAGVNLLDLLTRSATKRSSLKKVIKKHNLASKFNRHIKNDQANLGYFSRTNLHPQHPANPSPPHYSEYVEGRTPYRVDISSENDFPRIHADPQVDVLPPPFPQHLHLMKPYHLEAEPTIVQHPAVLQQSPGKFVEIFNHLGGRVFKSVRENPVELKKIHTNEVLLIGDGKTNDNKGKSDETYDFKNKDLNRDHFFSTIFDSLNLNDYNEYTSKARTAAFEDVGDEDNWELKLIGATEQCGPDGKRDSYGICQFASNLN